MLTVIMLIDIITRVMLKSTMLSVIMLAVLFMLSETFKSINLSIVILVFNHIECRNQYHHAECQYVECSYAESNHAEC